MPEQMITVATFTTAPINDETLTRRVCRALNDIKPLDRLGAPLHVKVSNGVVTLRGVVATYLIKTQILQTVCGVPGVRQVCEELWV